jgi:hypothetical protein
MRTIRLAQSLLVVFLLLLPVASAWAADPPYRSPMRAQCEGELDKDKAWQAELRQSVRPEVHQEDANIMAKNKKHVVMAYGALWGLTVVFVALLWLRQRRLVGELDALQKRIAKATAE